MHMEEGKDESHALYGELDITKANSKVWLVKVPLFLAEIWEGKPAGTDLGKVRITQNQDKTTDVTASLNVQEFPTDYTLVTAPPPVPMNVFAQTSDGSLSMEGVVQVKCDINPHDSKAYRSLCRKRTIEANVRGRPMQQLQDTDILVPFHKTRTFTNTIARKKRKVDDNGMLDKRERMDRDKLMEQIFSLFSKHDYWSLKDINMHLVQPVNYLKTILDEVCIYHASGPHKSSYELKPEYRTTPKQERDNLNPLPLSSTDISVVPTIFQ